MKGKSFIILISILLLIICLYYLSFTYYTYKIEKKASIYANGDSKKEQKYLNSISNKNTNFLFIKYNYLDAKNKSLNLGLDLKGGINVILQVSERELLLKISENSKNPVFLSALDQADYKQKTTGISDYLKLFFLAFKEQKKKQKSNVNLSSLEIFGKKSFMSEINYNNSDEIIKKAIQKKIKNSISVIYDIIRSRIDRFGLTQSNIQLIKGSNRILVELPGIKDVDRIKNLLQSTAKLQFYIVYSPQEVYNYFQLLNKYFLSKKNITNSYLRNNKSKIECIIKNKNFLKKERNNKDLFQLLNIKKAFSIGEVGLVNEENLYFVKNILNHPKAIELLPNYLKNIKFIWSAKPKYNKGKKQFILFAVQIENNGNPIMSGDVISDSERSFDQFNNVIVNIKMNHEGSKKWKYITEKNINKRIAIVLDNLVYTAPIVNSIISNGQSQISGNFSIKEADDLVNILSAGKLPVSIKITQFEIIGPSLGEESIKNGLNSSFIALIFILLWMLFYYSTAGFYTNLSVIFNLLFLFGILISLGAVLTLSGISGIVLILAMAVDSNILLYERVKEELHEKKSLRIAIDQSYSFKGAFSSIIDGQVTALLIGIILFFFGKGPIKGFATTLIIGIFTSLFSSIFLVRCFIEWHFSKFNYLSFFNKFTEYFLKNIQYDFLSKRKYAYIFSSIFMLIGLISLLTKGLNLGVDFVGGRTYIIRFNHIIKPNEVSKKISKIFIENGHISFPEVKIFGKKNQLKITTKYKANEDSQKVDNEIIKKLYFSLKSYLPKYLGIQDFKNIKKEKFSGILSSLKIGPSVAKDITKKAFLSVFFSFLIVFFYIFIRFKKWQFSLGAIISLLHDILVIFGIFSIFYNFLPFSLEVDQSFVAAILTVIGYSINDTIIIYDRIREYILKNPYQFFRKTINEAINSTLSRTMNTSLITIFVLFIIFLFGGESIRNFIFALLVGIIFGTYSSIFISTSLMYDFIKKKFKKTKKFYLENY